MAKADTPYFSIITINLNNVEGLRKTVLSVVSQNFNDFEYIVIDGGSIDGSVEIIKKFSDKIDHWLSEQDNGVYHAMNKGIRKAKGEYILFLNSGDTLVDDSILSNCRNYGFTEDYVFGRINLVSDNKVLQYDRQIPNTDISLLYLCQYGIPHQSSFIKMDLFEQFGFYDEDLKIMSDWKFFLQTIVMNNGSLNFLPLTISNYDVNGMSANMELLQLEKAKILEALVPHRILKDINYLINSYKDIQRINWLKKHPFYYTIYILITRFGRFIERLKK
jgi:glycosyltransferase involved in cell wall biosynthesis